MSVGGELSRSKCLKGYYMAANKEQCIHSCVCWHYNGDGLIVPCESDCRFFEESVKTSHNSASRAICPNWKDGKCTVDW